MMGALLLVGLLLIGLRSEAQAVPDPSTYSGIPTSEVLLEWLHSPEPRLQAWAAHWILVNKLTSLVPDLESQMERTSPVLLSDAARVSNYRASLAIFDTLIQLGAIVPAATVQRIEKLGSDAATEELVLLSRLPSDEAGAAIRSFYKPAVAGGAAATRVAAQLLAMHPPKGFGAEVMASILVTGRIWVHDPDDLSGSGSGFSSCCGAGGGLRADDWPEIGRYSFQNPPFKGQPVPEGEILFLSAPDPVYLLRSLHYRGTSSCPGGFALNDAIRSHLVGTLLRGSSASPFPEQPVYLDIPFTTRESYRARVQAFVDDQQDNFYKVASALTALNLLTEEERQAATLRVHLSVEDVRRQPADDLPVIRFRPPVEWIAAP